MIFLSNRAIGAELFISETTGKFHVGIMAHTPTPILVVEVLSGTTRRRDLVHKRALYLDAALELARVHESGQ